MNFSRNDTFNISIKDDFTSVITREISTEENSLSLSFSSERFNSNDFEEEKAIDSIDNAGNLFTGFNKKKPTLEEALEHMGYEKYKELYTEFLKKSKDKLKVLEFTGITSEDIAVIFCYTFEWDKKKFGNGEKSIQKTQ